MPSSTPVAIVGVVPADGQAASADPDSADRSEEVQAVSLPSTDPANRRPRWLAFVCRILRRGRMRSAVQVHYPPRFKALGAIVLAMSLTWAFHYLLTVLPTIEEHSDTPCKYNDNQLTYNARMLFVYFGWFAVARLSLFVPCIAARVAQVQSRTHGFCRTYCVHLVLRDGPLYIFVVGSLLFWFHLMQSPNCEQRSPELYRTLKLYAIYSCLVSIFCLLLAYWHNKLLLDALRDMYQHEDRSAPPDLISKLETRAYDPALFGDEDGKMYPSECAICLLAWEPEDVIKVTPCGHTFHEECLGSWLSTARTCALCRQDLTKNATRLAVTGSTPESEVPAETVGTTLESRTPANNSSPGTPEDV